MRPNLGRWAESSVKTTPAPFEVRRVDRPLGVILTLVGELDLATVPVLQEQLDRVMGGKGAVIIDLSVLRFIDSSGLHMLVRAEEQLRGLGGKLVLVHGSRAVRRVFELTNLDRYFAWCDSPSPASRIASERRIRARPIPNPLPTDKPRTSLTADAEERCGHE